MVVESLPWEQAAVPCRGPALISSPKQGGAFLKEQATGTIKDKGSPNLSNSLHYTHMPPVLAHPISTEQTSIAIRPEVEWQRGVKGDQYE